MNTNKTEIVFLLDRSGSMAGLERETINGFNAFLEKTCHPEHKTSLTTVLFDDEYEILWDGVDALSVLLTDKEYYVRGCTALLDAIGKTILSVGTRLSQTKEEDRPNKVIFVITTDGMENASLEFTYDKVKDLITHQQEKYNWNFIFLGANIDAISEAGQLGISEEQVYEFVATNEGVERLYSQVLCDMVRSIQEEK